MWKDKKAKKSVIAAPSKHFNILIDVTTKRGKVITKLTLVHEYDQSMHGCDHLDQFVSY